MLWLYLLAFCRITIGLLFAASFGGKVRNRKGFAQTINRFGLLPQRWSYPLALFFLGAELLVVILIIWGGPLLAPAFGLAALLLALFTTALVAARVRHIQTGCHCFGSSQRPVSAADVWRNIGLMLAAGAGLWAATMTGDAHASLTWGELLFIAIPTGVFVLVWANLRDIVALFQTA